MSTTVQEVPVLTVVAGDRAGRRYALAGADVVVGRGPEALLRLDNPWVEDRHAVLRCRVGGLEVEDLGSTDGTWVNGQRVTAPMTVRPGDVLRVADVVLEVGTGPLPERAPEPPAPPPTETPTPAAAPMPARAASGDPAPDAWDDAVQGRGPGLMLLAVGSAMAVAGFALWAWMLLTTGDDVRAASSLPAESPLNHTVGGVPIAPVAFAFLAGGGVLALIGGAWFRAAHTRLQESWGR